jgi:DNA modification methylase
MRKKTLTDRTVLEALAQIAGQKSKGQQPEPAWLHPFPARMPMSVAEHLIRQITTPEAVILDPMVGSGTSVIAARRLGRYGLGFERDPLALLIARSAVASLDAQRLERLGARILDRAMRAVRSEAVRLSNPWGKMPPEDRRFVDYWFPPQSQEQLFALARAIKEEACGVEKDFAWVVFSSLIIAKSAGASSALDLPRSRPHKRPDKVVVLPLEAWSRRFRAAVARLPFRNRQPTVAARILHGDARNLPLEDRTIDLVLTSPPYLNAIDYLRAHKFSLVWMGYNLEQLRGLRGTMVGTERGLWTLDGLPRGLERRLADVLDQHRERAQRRRYLSDLGKVVAEIARVLRPGGLALLAVGPTIISSKRSDAPDVLAALGQKVSLRLVGSVARNLRAAHRSLPPPTPGTGSPLSDRMRREVIVALRK